MVKLSFASMFRADEVEYVYFARRHILAPLFLSDSTAV